MQNNIKEILYRIAYEERLRTLKMYGNTNGKCIETSDKITERLINELHLDAHPYKVYVLYENFESCMEYCYEEHWITYVLFHGQRIYIDTTMDQFQWAFSKQLPKIYIDDRLPIFYLNKEPGKVILDKCGWNDWYNYGNYINNFEYYNDCKEEYQ